MKSVFKAFFLFCLVFGLFSCKDESKTCYHIQVGTTRESNHGVLKVSSVYSPASNIITVSSAAEDGYALDKSSLRYRKQNGAEFGIEDLRFIMPAEDIVLLGDFVEVNRTILQVFGTDGREIKNGDHLTLGYSADCKFAAFFVDAYNQGEETKRTLISEESEFKVISDKSNDTFSVESWEKCPAERSGAFKLMSRRTHEAFYKIGIYMSSDKYDFQKPEDCTVWFYVRFIPIDCFTFEDINENEKLLTKIDAKKTEPVTGSIFFDKIVEGTDSALARFGQGAFFIPNYVGDAYVSEIGSQLFMQGGMDAEIQGKLNTIKYLHIPASVKVIQAAAFSNLESLDSVYFYSLTPPAIAVSAFSNSGALKIRVPQSAIGAYKSGSAAETDSSVPDMRNWRVYANQILSANAYTIRWGTISSDCQKIGDSHPSGKDTELLVNLDVDHSSTISLKNQTIQTSGNYDVENESHPVLAQAVAGSRIIVGFQPEKSQQYRPTEDDGSLNEEYCLNYSQKLNEDGSATADGYADAVDNYCSFVMPEHDIYLNAKFRTARTKIVFDHAGGTKPDEFYVKTVDGTGVKPVPPPADISEELQNIFWVDYGKKIDVFREPESGEEYCDKDGNRVVVNSYLGVKKGHRFNGFAYFPIEGNEREKAGLNPVYFISSSMAPTDEIWLSNSKIAMIQAQWVPKTSTMSILYEKDGIEHMETRIVSYGEPIPKIDDKITARPTKQDDDGKRYEFTGFWHTYMKTYMVNGEEIVEECSDQYYDSELNPVKVNGETKTWDRDEYSVVLKPGWRVVVK